MIHGVEDQIISLAKEALNWRPKILLDEGLARTTGYFKTISQFLPFIYRVPKINSFDILIKVFGLYNAS